MYDFVLGRIHSRPGPHVACQLQVGHPCNHTMSVRTEEGEQRYVKSVLR